MAKITFASNIKSIITGIETAQKNLEQSKLDGLKMLATAAFNQAGDKYLVKGNFSVKSKSGKSNIYLTPPGANINSNKTTYYNPKTGRRGTKQVPMFVKGKFVSRTGNYQRILNALALAKLANGTNMIEGVNVTIQSDGIRVYADSQSEVFMNETFRQQGRTPISPITKSFRSVVNLWKSVRIKLGK